MAESSNQHVVKRVRMGVRVREIRQARGLTLAQLAKRSGLAVSTLSKVERGLMALTYDRFSQLADGLDTDTAALFDANGEPFPAGGVAIARQGEFGLHETEHYVYEMLFPELWQKSMTPMLGSLKAHDTMRFDRFVRHPGQEFLMVLEGQVTIRMESRDPVTLQCNESIYFDSGRGHLYASAGPQDARILVVCCAESVARKPA